MVRQIYCVPIGVPKNILYIDYPSNNGLQALFNIQIHIKH